MSRPTSSMASRMPSSSMPPPPPTASAQQQGGAGSSGLAPLYSIPPTVQSLAAPVPLFIDSVLPAYLSSCMISTLKESTGHVVRKRRKLEQEMREGGLLGSAAAGAQHSPNEEQEIQEGVNKRLRSIGMRAGANVAERLTIGRQPFPNDLEAMKFICKEFFIHIYGRQIDNLRTNHKGTFVLQSNALPPLIPLSTTLGPQADLRAGMIFTLMTTGMLQGALERLGVPCTVTAESNGLPRCTFQIKTIQQVSQAPLPPLPTSSSGSTSTAPAPANARRVSTGPGQAATSTSAAATMTATPTNTAQPPPPPSSASGLDEATVSSPSSRRTESTVNAGGAAPQSAPAPAAAPAAPAPAPAAQPPAPSAPIAERPLPAQPVDPEEEGPREQEREEVEERQPRDQGDQGA